MEMDGGRGLEWGEMLGVVTGWWAVLLASLQHGNFPGARDWRLQLFLAALMKGTQQLQQMRAGACPYQGSASLPRQKAAALCTALFAVLHARTHPTPLATQVLLTRQTAVPVGT
ncbi:hypothetical protein L211DRAFT_109265 [Terfezia boudieri ATCC MYA-4762]|uniref:Uncharacterized protein n=1 Tax=Terfezia boudieri ATCC MYA-4762 TaxID=1051890 RepID=A0A3N4LUC3_9PEZI|nr:hypothetical protein L211DRAFT_109265 [Terfezia boudieri ATCC MYA-4762]